MMHIQLQAHYYDQYCKLQLYNLVSCSTAWTMRRTHKEFIVNIVKSEILKTHLGIEILTDRASCLVGKKKALSVFISHLHLNAFMVCLDGVDLAHGFGFESLKC